MQIGFLSNMPIDNFGVDFWKQYLMPQAYAMTEPSNMNDFLDFVYQEESSSGKSTKTTGGGYEIKEVMYNDVIRLNPTLAKYSYDEMKADDTIGRLFAKSAFEINAPHYAKAYGYEDTPETKIAFWNWGLRGMKKADYDVSKAPPITQRYIKRWEERGG